MGGPTRPSSAMFGYTLPHGTHVPIPRLRPGSVHTMRTPESSTSEEEDRADLLGRNFQVPRPKSRSSVAVSNPSNLHYFSPHKNKNLLGRKIPISFSRGAFSCKIKPTIFIYFLKMNNQIRGFLFFT